MRTAIYILSRLIKKFIEVQALHKMIDKSKSYNKTAFNTIHFINLINIIFIEVIKHNELKKK